MAKLVLAGVLKTPFVLRFQSLFNPGRALSFPCSADGQVDIDGLTEQGRCNYFGARALIGSEYAFPVVQHQATGLPS
jgi:hypothetical protein